jgi:hypothetical protein
MVGHNESFAEIYKDVGISKEQFNKIKEHYIDYILNIRQQVTDVFTKEQYRDIINIADQEMVIYEKTEDEILLVRDDYMVVNTLMTQFDIGEWDLGDSRRVLDDAQDRFFEEYIKNKKEIQ